MYVLFAVGMLSALVLGRWGWQRRQEALERELWRLPENVPANVLPFPTIRPASGPSPASPPGGPDNLLPFPTPQPAGDARWSGQGSGDGLRPR